MTPIPLTFRAAPLPTEFDGTPQEFLDAIVDRLTAESSTSLSFFAAGTVAPTSNVGPWLKNFITWYVWSDSLATYVPETIEFESLRYIASQTEPDQTKYVLWIKLDGTGKAIGMYYYSGGSWQDIYADQFAAALLNLTTNYSTTAQMNTAIDSAVGGQSRHAFGAFKTSTQTVIAGAGDIVVGYTGETYDTDGDYDAATSTYTAPENGIYSFNLAALIQRASGTPTAVQTGFNLLVNGIIRVSKSNQLGDEGDFQTLDFGCNIQLSAGDAVTITISFGNSGGASTWDISPDTPSTYFEGFLIQKL